MHNLYRYISMVAEKATHLDATAGKPYMDLACDMKADIDRRNDPTTTSDKVFLEYVRGRMRDRDMEAAYKDFIRNYNSWLKRNRR